VAIRAVDDHVDLRGAPEPLEQVERAWFSAARRGCDDHDLAGAVEHVHAALVEIGRYVHDDPGVLLAQDRERAVGVGGKDRIGLLGTLGRSEHPHPRAVRCQHRLQEGGVHRSRRVGHARHVVLRA
jgi:hypothetical protein